MVMLFCARKPGGATSLDSGVTRPAQLLRCQPPLHRSCTVDHPVPSSLACLGTLLYLLYCFSFVSTKPCAVSDGKKTCCQLQYNDTLQGNQCSYAAPSVVLFMGQGDDFLPMGVLYGVRSGVLLAANAAWRQCWHVDSCSCTLTLLQHKCEAPLIPLWRQRVVINNHYGRGQNDPLLVSVGYLIACKGHGRD